jgi:hypothetical protein
VASEQHRAGGLRCDQIRQSPAKLILREARLSDGCMSANGTSRTSGDVRLESAKWAKADIDQVALSLSLPAASALDANMIEGLDFGQRPVSQ